MAVRGRDELDGGETWNSNSVTAWTLATAGFDLAAVQPPEGGRGSWAGTRVCGRRQSTIRQTRNRMMEQDGKPAKGSSNESVRPLNAIPAVPSRVGSAILGRIGHRDGRCWCGFVPDSVSTYPAPVSRWLRHAIAPGTPVRGGVQISMHGDIRIKKWMPFAAEQIVAPTGYIWAARAGTFPNQDPWFRSLQRSDGSDGMATLRGHPRGQRQRGRRYPERRRAAGQRNGRAHTRAECSVRRSPGEGSTTIRRSLPSPSMGPSTPSPSASTKVGP